MEGFLKISFKGIKIFLIFIFLLQQEGCQQNVSLEKTPEFRDNCVEIDQGNFDIDDLDGTIISLSSNLDTVIVRNNLGYQSYTLKQLTADVLPGNENMLLTRIWFIEFLLGANKLVYEIMALMNDSTLLRIIGVIDLRQGAYRTIYVTHANSPDEQWNVVDFLQDRYLILEDGQRIDKLQTIFVDIITDRVVIQEPAFSYLYPDVFFHTDKVSRVMNSVSWPEYRFSPDRRYIFLYVSDTSGMKFVLWDEKQNKVVWEESIYAPSSWPPQWDASAREIAYVDGDTLNILFIKDKIYKLSLPENIHIPSAPFKWSPDGRYLAFGLDNTSMENNIDQQNGLAIYDVLNHTVENSCIAYQGNFFWAPDARRILIQQDNGWYTIYDIKKSYALTFSWDEYVIEWGK